MVLRIVAMVMGVVAGTLGLIQGLSDLFRLSLVATFVIASAIAGVVGAGIVGSQPLKGSVLMAVAGIALLCVMFLAYNNGFGSQIRGDLISPAALFLVAAILGYQSRNQS